MTQEPAAGPRQPRALVAALLALSVASPARVLAHQLPRSALGAQIVVASTTVDPVPGAGSRTEVRVLHPVLFGHVSTLGGQLQLAATVNLEGWVLPGGELTVGAWGEGFVDRRHPHTYVHELLLIGTLPLARTPGRAELSISAGKGFAPFGTDDPMMRPVLKYPINHHLSQILERAVIVVAVRVGPVGVEAGAFNGDEPERPGQWPAIRRFGDSWAVRSTLYPWPGVEVQLSHASVASPEHRPGAGLTQSKWSGSLRWQGTRIYTLAEWARASEAEDRFVFSSVLAEGGLRLGMHQPYARIERTDRPEELRTGDLFRSRRPHLENSILGTTRWTVYTAGYGVTLPSRLRGLELRPFVEGAYAAVVEKGSGLFDVESLYGGSHFWSGSVGLRLSWRAPDHRMGRYGAALDRAASHNHSH